MITKGSNVHDYAVGRASAGFSAAHIYRSLSSIRKCLRILTASAGGQFVHTLAHDHASAHVRLDAFEGT